MSACTLATTKVDELAHSYGFERLLVTGNEFNHVVYSPAIMPETDTLHIYLEGDGLPWLRPNIIAVDPTGSKPTALHLMSKDQNARIYLGRPCYYGLYNEPPCHPYYWTHGRYSQRVVDSMAQAINHFLTAHRYDTLVFIGYSGGGVLAMLLAEHFQQTALVITIAANLDIQAWTQHHGFSSLQTSLNPAQRLNLYKDLIQRHLAGGEDENVPPQIIRNFVTQQQSPKAQLLYYDDYDHRCCWIKNWPELLNKVLDSVRDD